MKTSFSRLLCGVLSGGAALLVAGCLDILGHKDRMLDPSGIGGTGGTGGSGTGGGGAIACMPGDQTTCYSGPKGTDKVGLCEGGKQTCDVDGAGFGACEEEVLPAQETCKDTADENCDGFDCVLWSAVVANNVIVVGADLKLDAQGNIYLAGDFEGSLNLGGETLIAAGGSDIFVAKFDVAGKHLWSKSFGDSQDNFRPSLAVTPNGDVAIGGFENGATLNFGGDVLSGIGYVARFNPAGVHQWSRSYGGEVTAVGMTKDGEVIAAGSFAGTVDFGKGLRTADSVDVFVLRLDPVGEEIWTKRYGGPDYDYPTAMAVDPAGNTVLVGEFVDSITFEESFLLSADGAGEMFVVRLDAQGTDAWSKLISNTGNNNYDRISTIATDGSGAVTIGGAFGGNLDVGGTQLQNVGALDGFVVHWSAAGQLGWAKAIASPAVDVVLGVAGASDGSATILVGTFGDIDVGGGILPTAGASDTLVAKFAPDGTHAWSRRFGDAGKQVPFDLATDIDDNLVLACSVESSVDFGNGALSPTGIGLAMAKIGP